VLLYCTVLDRDCKIITKTYDILWQDEEAQDKFGWRIFKPINYKCVTRGMY